MKQADAAFLREKLNAYRVPTGVSQEAATEAEDPLGDLRVTRRAVKNLQFVVDALIEDLLRRSTETDTETRHTRTFLKLAAVVVGGAIAIQVLLDGCLVGMIIAAVRG